MHRELPTKIRSSRRTLEPRPSSRISAADVDSFKFRGVKPDPDPVAFDTDRINSQRVARPAVRNCAVRQVERCGMMRTNKPPVGDVAAAEVGLLVRASTLAGSSAAMVRE